MREGLARLLLDIRDDEIGVCLWSAAYFFFVLCGYFIMRPLREAMGLAHGVGELSWLFLGTLSVTLAANPLYGSLVARYPKRVFIPVVYRFSILCLLVFYVIFTNYPQRLGANAGRVFYVWLSVFNVFAVCVFWAYMADRFSLEQGKRLFGFIGIGGTLGALAGAAITTLLVRKLGTASLFLVAAGMLEVAVWCMRKAGGYRLQATGYREGNAGGATAGVGAAQDELLRTRPLAGRPGSDSIPDGVVVQEGGALHGIAQVLSSPYLLGVCGYILLLTVSATFLYFAQARIVADAVVEQSARATVFGTIDFWTQALTLFTQLFLTGRIVRVLGVGPTLIVMPLITAGGFLALGAAPTLSVLIIVQVLHRAGKYALARPARETLFTVVSEEEKYKAKAFVDTFVYRGGDAFGALADKGLAALGLGMAAVGMMVLPVAVAWGGLGLYLGAMQRRKAAVRRTLAGAPQEGALGLEVGA